MSMSFRRASRSPLARSIARLLIAALLVTFLPADASASLPRPTFTLFEERPERTCPVLSEAQANATLFAGAMAFVYDNATQAEQPASGYSCWPDGASAPTYSLVTRCRTGTSCAVTEIFDAFWGPAGRD